MRRLFSASCLVLLLFVYVTPAFSAEPERVRIGVLSFESRTQGVHQQHAGIITDMFTRNLANSRTIAVLEREQLTRTVGREIRLGASGLVDPATAAEIGQVTGARYLLTGAVTRFSEKVDSGKIFGISYVDYTADVTIDIRLINTMTGEIALALAADGSHKTSKTSMGSMTSGARIGDVATVAIEEATTKLARQIRQVIGKETSHVINIAGDRIMIDVGSMAGSKVDDLYLVYADGAPIRVWPDDKIVGYDKVNIAIIKVREVASTHSICTSVPEGGNPRNIRRGDKIEHIESASSRDMARRRAFVRERPAPPSQAEQWLRANVEGGGSSTPPPPQPAVTTSPPAAAPAPTPTPTQTPTPPPAQPAAQQNLGFDPNRSTNIEVIQSYPLPPGTLNVLGIRHRNAQNLYNNRNYKEAHEAYSALVDTYDGDYLAAYWAGMSAQQLNNRAGAIGWYDKAIKINPNYQPAIEARRKM